MSGLGRMMVGGGKGNSRPDGDFYPTPPNVTEALWLWLAGEGLVPPCSRVWDPACGDGAIARHLIARGHPCDASDIHDRGYGQPGIDFLDARWPYQPCAIVTNPPYADIQPVLPPEPARGAQGLWTWRPEGHG